MMNKNIITLTCFMFCATFGWTQPEASQGVKKEMPASQTDAMLGKLTIIIGDYATDPETVLSRQNISDLEAFTANSLESRYDSLSQSDRNMLSQIVHLNSEKFSQSILAKFSNDQKLGARMSTQDIETLKTIVVAIRDGKTLTPRQVSDLKDFKVMISKNAYAFISELSLITQYVGLNQNVFSGSDLVTFRQASADASGLTPDELRLLKTIAKQNTTNLNREEVKVLKNLALKAPLGTLNSLDPQVIFILHKIINNSENNFSSNIVSVFNNEFNNNQGIQLSGKNNNQPLEKNSGPTSAGGR